MDTPKPDGQSGFRDLDRIFGPPLGPAGSSGSAGPTEPGTPAEILRSQADAEELLPHEFPEEDFPEPQVEVEGPGHLRQVVPPMDQLSTQSFQPDLVLIVGREGKILFANHSVEGVPESDFVGGSLFDYVQSDHQTGLRQALDQAFAGEGTGYECQGLDPAYPEAWFQFRISPNHRQDQVVSATVIARDITDRKQLEERLRSERDLLRDKLEERAVELAKSSEALEAVTGTIRTDEQMRLRRIVDQAGEALFLTDPLTGRFVEANETACKWLQRDREQLLRMRVQDLDLEFPLQVPEHRKVHVTETRSSRRPAYVDEGRHRRRNGTAFPVEVAISRVTFWDEELVLAVARDIKGRQHTAKEVAELESRYRTLFEMCRDAVYLSARDGSIVDVNDAAVHAFGYSRDQLVGMEAHRLYQNPNSIEAFQDIVAQHGQVRDLEVTFLRKDRTPFDGLLSVSLRHDAEGGLLGYQCVIHEVRGTLPKESTRVSSSLPAVTPVPREETTGHPPGPAQAVLVVDPVKRVREQASNLLELAGFSVHAVEHPHLGLALLGPGGPFGVVLLDIDPSQAETEQILAGFKQVQPDVSILLLSGGGDRGAARLMRQGLVQGTIRKPLQPLSLVQTVRDTLLDR